MSQDTTTETAGQRFVRIRGILRKAIPEDFNYIPRDAQQFLKVSTPQQMQGPGGGTYFPLPLSEKDEKEALELARKCGITIPEEHLSGKVSCCHH